MKENWPFTPYRVLVALIIMCIGFMVSALTSLYLSTAAHSEPMCAEYKAIQAALLEKYHEQPTSAGLAQEGKAAYTVFSAPDGESWTLVIVGVDGKSCVIATGEHWADLSPGKGEPT